MRKHILGRSIVFVMPCIAAAYLSAPGAVQADETGAVPGHTAPEHLLLITLGGLLYDKWYGVLGTKSPKESHPAYPKAGKQKGASTWRCKECHGWDYKGNAGAYSKGSHHTGIQGIRNVTHAPISGIVAVLKGKTHRFGNLIPEKDLEALAHFVAHGQIDMDEYIDRPTKKVKGDRTRGERIFQTTCANCHGSDGKQINFKTPPDVEYIGTVANANPWETLHKIRMGQPGVPMISMLAFDIKDHVDILAYTQTLPQK